MGKRRYRLHEAAALQGEIRERHGQDADAVMAGMLAERSGASRAEATYRRAMARNRGLSFRAVDTNLPRRVLYPEETVHEVAVGAARSDTFPLLIVTDRRVLIVMDRLRGWTVLEEAPAAAVTGAALEERLLSARFRVRVRWGRDLTMKVRHRERSQEVVDLLQHLVAGGAPPSWPARACEHPAAREAAPTRRAPGR
ncbi:PH domain-containing protein [Brachybacterium sp. EE-P12]|jgi:hypothetical protein|uniref:PH domain-containing protein n=1 Tax=Brachybacterium sp. EE-P12 TaxID=2306299 RepID=UPI000F0948E5|nr:PH domain-containing protein [Brachybacterium sp. EE-P12]